MYADDTHLIYAGDNADNIQLYLNQDLETVFNFKTEFNPLTSRPFLLKTQFLHVLEIFRLDSSQTSLNLLKKAFATCQHAFLSTSVTFRDICAQACAKIKILKRCV